MSKSFWGRTKSLQLMKRPIQIYVDNNFNFSRGGGGYIMLLPFVNVFPPIKHHRSKWTIHFGWLIFTVVIHFFPSDKLFVHVVKQNVREE